MFNPNSTMLAGVSRSTLQQWLADAQSAYQQLVMGEKEVAITYDNRTVHYAAADSAKLENWIGLLQRQLGVSRGRRAMRVYFR